MRSIIVSDNAWFNPSGNGVIADTEGTPYGPGGEPAWTVLWLDGSTSIATDDELYIA